MDIIHLLPDSVANQIAAGEVVQRPSSVVKELVENAIDAGATSIKIIIKDGGRTLIQVIDDGKGMSPTDARMSFERHATSKISQATDLFALATMGFRGEALASIAAVAQVELITRSESDEVGTRLCLSGGHVDSQEPINCQRGCNMSVKNLFFNIPARRKFLKSNSTEFSDIERVFFRIALVYPQVSFELINNDQTSFTLPVSSLRERISHIFGKKINNQLYSIEAKTDFASIEGFVGTPESATQRNDKQYFFVNGRFMKHPYFQKAVFQAYDRLIPPGGKPSFFINMVVDPSTIDVNIHPTKTEIKFEHEQAIWPILLSATREAIGRFNISGSIDFDDPNSFELPPMDMSGNREVEKPTIQVDEHYNPFAPTSYNPFEENVNQGNNINIPSFNTGVYNRGAGGSAGPASKRNLRSWDSLYSDFEKEGKTGSEDKETDELPDNTNSPDLTFQSICTPTQGEINFANQQTSLNTDSANLLQFRNKYILLQSNGGLMCIDQHRAHFRVLFDQTIVRMESHNTPSQRLLLPEQFDLTPAESLILADIADDLQEFGYDIAPLGNNTFMVNGVPIDNPDKEAQPFIEEIVSAVKNEDLSLKDQLKRKVAIAQSRAVAIRGGQKLQQEEMKKLVKELFDCAECQYTPDGKPIIALINDDEIEKKFK